jgi:HD-GYP domain-containing protein (c-di-GMP phosphodiesterase class II)
LHDIGKIGVADAILLKDGPLTGAEWHEERFDGSGYPRGLAGERIPLWSRLFAVIDTLDAMTSDRPYRKARSFDVARAEIVALGRKQFDPLAVAAFLAEEATLREMVGRKCEEPAPALVRVRSPI